MNSYIGIIGSRALDYDEDFSLAEDQFFDIYQKGDIIVSGGCPAGGDRLAKLLHTQYNIPYLEFPADWNRLGKAAGPIRNEKMAKHVFKKPVDFGIRIDDEGTKYFWMTGVGIPGDMEFPLKSDGSMADFNSLVSKVFTFGKSYFKNLDSKGNPDADDLNLTLKSMIQTALKSVKQLPS